MKTQTLNANARFASRMAALLLIALLLVTMCAET